jgi:hypothetical protein
MPDNLNDPGPQDGKRISLTEEHELDYWTSELGISRSELFDAVDAVGHRTAAVRDYLGKRRKS